MAVDVGLGTSGSGARFKSVPPPAIRKSRNVFHMPNSLNAAGPLRTDSADIGQAQTPGSTCIVNVSLRILLERRKLGNYSFHLLVDNFGTMLTYLEPLCSKFESVLATPRCVSGLLS
jgi:hypothetical protein